MSEGRGAGYILGLDIGSSSIGWAAVAEGDGGEAGGIAGVGARVFEAGMDDIESGKDASRAAARREARSIRRRLERRSRRLMKLGGALQRRGLLPEGDIKAAGARKEYFDKLDAALAAADGGADAAMLPYRLRAKALDEALSPHEIGRALYHICQRRGYKSNRKDLSDDRRDKEKEESKKVESGIADLRAKMAEAGARTLGEYLSKLDPAAERLRSRYTHRDMYSDEFEAIWSAQAPRHPGAMTDEAKKEIHRAIFFQRPLKSQKNLRGRCELETGCPRAPIALMVSQRFRLLQKVNDLKFRYTDTKTGEIFDGPLDAAQRELLAAALDGKGEMTFGAIRKLLGLKGHQKFNFEEEGKGGKGLIGNKTASRLASVFGPERWAAFSDSEKDEIVQTVRGMRDETALAAAGARRWGLAPDAAARFGSVSLEDGYCALSQRALKKILPLMRQGAPYSTAVKEVYGAVRSEKVHDTLPPLQYSPMPTITNPTVRRALTELRKVVNAIIAKHGKPEYIRVELARDIKKSKKEREEIWKKNIANRKEREKAVSEMLKETGGREPSGRDIEKWLLAEECDWTCPYTGDHISRDSLIGPNPAFDIEHIIPFHRSFDNSFMNKTLCRADENRNVKRNRTPYETYGGTDEWEAILQRVRRFKGNAAKAKLEKFMKEKVDDLDGFCSRQMNDTRYASLLAVRYLGLLYGAGAQGIDAEGKRRVQAGRGGVTAHIRDSLGLNAILGDGRGKNRDDHRHHAVDAICAALSDAGIVKRMSDAAEESARGGRRGRFEHVAPPWDGFQRDARDAVRSIVVSHRPRRRVNSALHEQTTYSKTFIDPSGSECVHIRKRVESLSGKEDIVDPAVRKAVESKLAELGVSEPSKAFKDPANLPYLTTRDGRRVPIRKVRIRVKTTIKRIGDGASARNIKTGSNHHVEIFEVTDKKGNPKWEGRVVTTIEAMTRRRNSQPVIDRTHPDGGKFLFSLCGGDVIALKEDEGDNERLFVVRTIKKSSGNARLEYVSITDARKKEQIISNKNWYSGMMEPLRKKGCRKMNVTPLGEVIPAND